MTKIGYEKPAFDFTKAPKGKIPFAEIDGKLIGDSSLIIDKLKEKHGDPLDGKLSNEEKAQMRAIQILIEEHFYFAGAWLRWHDEESLAHVRKAFLGFLPPVIGKLIFKKIRRDFLNLIKQQGMGSHTREEIIQFAKDDLTALSHLLGNKPFFLGNDPTSLDACAFGFLTQQLETPWEGPLKAHSMALKNLVDYNERMKKRYW